MEAQGFGGRPRRRRVTRRSVHVAEVLSRVFITLGGLGTIIAVTMIFLFLLYVVGPLFQRPDVASPSPLALPVEVDVATTVQAGVDEYGQIGWIVRRDGELITTRLATGELLDRRPLFEGRVPTVAKVDSFSGEAAFGFEDGTVVLGSVGFRTDFLPPDTLTPEQRALEVGEQATHERGVLTHIAGDQWRHLRIVVELEEPFSVGSGDPIRLIDFVDNSSDTSRHEFVAALVGESELRVYDIRRRKNLMTGKVQAKVHEYEVPFDLPTGRTEPLHLFLLGNGGSLLVIWEDGYLQRFDLRDLDAPVLAQDVDLVREPGERMTAASMLLGRTTLLAGDSLGRLRAWFEVTEDRGDAAPLVRLVEAHGTTPNGSDVTWITSSQRMRLAATSHADGAIRLFHVTTDQVLVDIAATGNDAAPIALLPRDNGLLAFGSSPARRVDFDLKYPESTVASMFLPVWYEGANKPEHVWQSSSGTDSFEPKLGLYPLVFGTLKATFYSLLFGAPIALMAAVFASEFLNSRLRGTLKSLIEMMAGLPSVVLGFLAALVIAPLVQGVIPGILSTFFMIPYCLLLSAYGFQLLPKNVVLRLSGWPRFFLILLALVPGVWAGSLLGPVFERLLFGGDLRSWLSGQQGSGIGGWVLLFVPICAIATAWGIGRWVNPRLRDLSKQWSRSRCAMADLAKFVLGTGVAVLLAVIVGNLLDSSGFDPRGEPLAVVGTYVQRNALIVGFVMGFAIIPIIYTLAEDALTSVPAHLREASLGAGATHWQTAVRIVIPTAMSGLFSALMIGLGRAVGETMIVLMATGNTPVMEWNIFNGFRTLSANIAVELPEAVKGSAHYRTLFLAALVLFAMTFVVNTMAEVVRQRFRKRAYQL